MCLEHYKLFFRPAAVLSMLGLAFPVLALASSLLARRGLVRSRPSPGDHSGNALNSYPHSIFDPFTTLATTIAALLDGALTDTTGMGLHALAEVGLVLLAITLITNFAGRLITRRFSDAGLPVGRGV